MVTLTMTERASTPLAIASSGFSTYEPLITVDPTPHINKA